MTERLFDADSYMSEFEARVVSCTPKGERFEIVLDRTAFFPEGGGQSSDTGYIGNAFVSYVYERDGIIYHVTDAPAAGGKVHGKIDFDERFRKMQNHTGEHILSGIIHREYGLNNVGFHLSDEYVRVDFDGVLDACKIDAVEKAANYAVAENHKVKAWYPDERELEKIEYRSKIDICKNVRIVDVEGVDVCACCAPHVSETGQIGIIKIVDFMKYKSGTRIFMTCGSDALRLFIDEHRLLGETAALLSLKREEVGEAVKKMKAEIQQLKRELSSERALSMKNALRNTEYTDGNLCFFFDGADMQSMRNFANEAVKKCAGIAAVFSKEEDGYKYVVASEGVDLKNICIGMNEKLRGKGGGSSVMLQGSCGADMETIKKYFGI